MAKVSKYQAIIELGAKLDKKFGPALQSANKLVNGFGKGVATAGKTAAVGLGIVGAGAVAAGAAAVKLGTTVVGQFGELEQNLGGSEAVFGEYAAKIQKTGENAYKNLGTSQSDYLATANKMGALFQGSGIDQAKSLELTEKAMQRAADMASVMGIDMQVALDSVAGAAKGNFTMMDNLGVAMNATNIEAYALSKGLKFTWKEATQAQKADVAMQMFFENTKQYAGNFAKESTETITGSLGLLKAATNSFMGGLGNADADMKNLTRNVTNAFKAVIKNVVPIIGNIATALPSAFEAIAPEVESLLPTLLGTGAKLAKQIFKMGIKLLPIAIGLSKEIGEKLFSSIGDAVPWLKPVFDALQNLLSSLFSGIKIGDIKSKFTEVAQIASQLLVPAINLGKKAIETVIGVFQKVSPVVAPIVGKAAALAQKFMEMADVILPILGSAFSTVFNIIVETASPVIDGVSMALGGLLDFITGVFTGNWELAWQGVQDIFRGAFGALEGFAKAPINAVISLINKAISGINSMSFKMPDWSPIMAGETIGFNIPNIPMLAKGVHNFSGGPAIVGEKGAELLNLPRGTDVYSNQKTKGIFSKLINTDKLENTTVTDRQNNNSEFTMLTEIIRNLSRAADVFMERGTELLNLLHGTDIYPDQETNSILSQPMDILESVVFKITVEMQNVFNSPVTSQQVDGIGTSLEKTVEAALARIEAKRRRTAFKE